MIQLKDALIAIADWLDSKALDEEEAKKQPEEKPYAIGFYGMYSDALPVKEPSYVSKTSAKFTYAESILDGYINQQVEGRLQMLIEQAQQEQDTHTRHGRGNYHPLYPEKG